jgi:hypothetical protein
MKKPSLKERYAALQTAARNYAYAVQHLQTRVHSTTPVNVTNSDGQVKGRATVTVEELIATAKAAELLGFETQVVPYDGGKALRLVFIQKSAAITIPTEFYAE